MPKAPSEQQQYLDPKAMSTTTASSERDFASNFLALLSVSESNNVISADFRRDLKDISTLGIKLPNLPIPKRQTTSGDSVSSSDQLIEVSFKSIKPPRFNVAFRSSASNTIFEVKTSLVKNDALQGIEPSQIKLLVKGKVIQDSVLLSSVAAGEEQVAFTAMINKDAASKSATPVSTPEPEISTITPESPASSSATTEIQLPWDEIKSLLEAKGIDSTKAVERLQKGWRLAK